MRIDNNTVGLACLTAIVIVSMALHIDGAKDITLALGGAIAGWLAKRSTE